MAGTVCNILITAGSRRVPLVGAFRSALESLGLEGRVVVVDVNPLSPAVHVADRAYLVPMADDPRYLDTLLDVCRSESISLLVPTIDDELEQLAGAVDRFRRLGTRVAVSPADTIRICRDKWATSRHLRAHGVAAAVTYLPSEIPAPAAFPLFVKPRVGRGGIGAFPIRSARELDFFLDYVDNPVVQEFLDGREYTIDILCDFAGRPLSIVPRERVVIRAGVIDRGRTVADDRLIDVGRAVARALPLRGPVNVQCRVVDGQPVIFEVNPRFSGGIPLTIAAGADIPRWLVELALGRRVASRVGRFTDQMWMTNYETSIFLDPSQIAEVQPVEPRAAQARGEAA